MKYLSLLLLISFGLNAGQVRYEDETTLRESGSQVKESDTRDINSRHERNEIQREEDQNAARPESALPAELDEDEIGSHRKGDSL